MNVPAFNEIWDEILSEKIIKKNKQYGNSIEEPALIFNGLMNPELLACVRIDDKLSRIKTLDRESPKYDSEIKEIIAYLFWLLILRKQEERDEAANDNSGYKGDTFQSPQDTGEIRKRRIPNLNIWRLCYQR